MKTQWKLDKELSKKGYKVYSGKLTFDLPKVYYGHIMWRHMSDIDFDSLIIRFQTYPDYFSNLTETEFLIYRQLMYEAGFYAIYSHVEENKSYYENLIGTWTHN